MSCTVESRQAEDAGASEPLNHMTPARSAFKQQHKPGGAFSSAFAVHIPVPARLSFCC